MLTTHFRVLGNAITTIFGAEHKNVQPIQTTPSSSTLKNLNSTKLLRTCCMGTDSPLVHAHSIFSENLTVLEKKLLDQIMQQPGLRVIEHTHLEKKPTIHLQVI